MFGFVSREDHRASSPAPPGYRRNAAHAKAAAPGRWGITSGLPVPETPSWSGTDVLENGFSGLPQLPDVPAGQLGERAGAPPQDRKTGADQRVRSALDNPAARPRKAARPRRRSNPASWLAGPDLGTPSGHTERKGTGQQSPQRIDFCSRAGSGLGDGEPVVGLSQQPEPLCGFPKLQHGVGLAFPVVLADPEVVQARHVGHGFDMGRGKVTRLGPGDPAGLAVDDHPEWRDGYEPGPGCSGLVSVLIARDAGRNRLSVCGYLVDVYCLGVKNKVGPLVMSARQCEEFTGQFFGAYPEPPLAATLELAQDLVCGAVESRSLGFEPAAEVHDVKGHLGGWSGPSAIRFGRDGKPLFVEGPYDNGRHIVRQLER